MSTTGPSNQRARPPTLEDVAARAGVSRALVSIVMREVPGASEATRVRVRALADQMGYVPDSRARLLASRHQRLIGVTVALNNPFHADVVEAVYASAAAAGYQVALSAVTAGRPSATAVDALLAQRCDGLILLGAPGRRRPAGSRGATGPSVPAVLVGQRGDGTDSIRVDDAAGLAMAVEHLIGLGHRHIAHLDGGRAPGSAARRRGYRAAMRAAGLAPFVVGGGDDEADGADAARTLLEDRVAALPTAVVTYNDRSAVGLLDTFARHGIDVPRDMSVIGFDDSNVARLPYVALTTIGQDAERMAEIAVRRVVDRILAASAPWTSPTSPSGTSRSAGTSTPAGTSALSVPSETVLPARLVVRRTTAAPRAADPHRATMRV